MAIDKIIIRTNAKKRLFEALEFYNNIDQKLKKNECTYLIFCIQVGK